MKRLPLILTIYLAAISVTAFGSNTSTKHQDSIRKITTVQHEKVQQKKLPAKTVYTCPMHAEVIQDKPGKCPKCRMILAKRVQVVKVMPQNK